MLKQITDYFSARFACDCLRCGFGKGYRYAGFWPHWTLEELLKLAQQRSANAFEASYVKSQFQDGELPNAAMNGKVDGKFERHVIADLKTPRFSFDIRRVSPRSRCRVRIIPTWDARKVIGIRTCMWNITLRAVSQRSMGFRQPHPCFLP